MSEFSFATVESLRDVLSPTALGVLEAGLAAARAAESFVASLSEIRAEGCSDSGEVWAAADGQGFCVALSIADTVLLGGYALEEVEDLISDAMIDAAGAGLAAGEQLLAAFRAAACGLLPPAGR